MHVYFIYEIIRMQKMNLCPLLVFFYRLLCKDNSKLPKPATLCWCKSLTTCSCYGHSFKLTKYEFFHSLQGDYEEGIQKEYVITDSIEDSGLKRMCLGYYWHYAGCPKNKCYQETFTLFRTPYHIHVLHKLFQSNTLHVYSLLPVKKKMILPRIFPIILY